ACQRAGQLQRGKFKNGFWRIKGNTVKYSTGAHDWLTQSSVSSKTGDFTYHISQEMIEGGITSRMSGIIENAGHHPSPQDYRLLTTDPSQLREEDLPGDLQSLSWLTSVDVPRLQQMADSRGHSNGPSQGSMLEQQTAQLSNISVTTGQGSMLHLQSNMQHSPLGINIINTHSGSCPTSAYQPTPQQVYSLTQTGQQGSTDGLYSNVSFNNQSLFSHPRLAPQEQDLQPKSFPKPIYSYSCLIAMALKNSKTGSLPVSEIYSFMKEHFPYFKTAPDGWKNSVRHNLSLNKCFEKVENKTSSASRKGCLWALNPAKIDKMEEEMQKWKRKDLPAIHRSMANPDELDKLITDRPENCRRKALEPTMGRIPSCPTGLPLPVPAQMQPQPIVTLSLPCLPMHQHHQLQAQLQAQARLAPMSPAPAQTPPLHAVPDLSQSPLTQQPGKPPDVFYIVHGDMHTEVDALDPSIVDFALQGNLWEEIKDDSFNLDALGTLSNSPLRLSDCDLVTANLPPASTGANLPLSDVQVTGLYASYTSQEPLSSQYMGAPASSKPIALL
uniref:Fork-head domain-containing protein n=1 Tax=Monopterus albus TaxID=43700 RepID=A0A3Q3JHY4_MONAL